MAGVRDPRKTVMMTHVPPYDSGLDTAPLLSPSLQPTASAGDVLRGPVGSHGVRAAIETFKPVLGVHGHIHESGGERRIGDTVCVNAGSEANHGVLRGYLVDLSETAWSGRCGWRVVESPFAAGWSSIRPGRGERGPSRRCIHGWLCEQLPDAWHHLSPVQLDGRHLRLVRHP